MRLEVAVKFYILSLCKERRFTHIEHSEDTAVVFHDTVIFITPFFALSFFEFFFKIKSYILNISKSSWSTCETCRNSC